MTRTGALERWTRRDLRAGRRADRWSVRASTSGTYTQEQDQEVITVVQGTTVKFRKGNTLVAALLLRKDEGAYQLQALLYQGKHHPKIFELLVDDDTVRQLGGPVVTKSRLHSSATFAKCFGQYFADLDGTEVTAPADELRWPRPSPRCPPPCTCHLAQGSALDRDC